MLAVKFCNMGNQLDREPVFLNKSRINAQFQRDVLKQTGLRRISQMKYTFR